MRACSWFQVDIYYYSLNCAAKKGVNLSSIFGIVHAANMAKRDPATGQVSSLTTPSICEGARCMLLGSEVLWGARVS